MTAISPTAPMPSDTVATPNHRLALMRTLVLAAIFVLLDTVLAALTKGKTLFLYKDQLHLSAGGVTTIGLLLGIPSFAQPFFGGDLGYISALGLPPEKLLCSCGSAWCAGLLGAGASSRLSLCDDSMPDVRRGFRRGRPSESLFPWAISAPMRWRRACARRVSKARFTA